MKKNGKIADDQEVEVYDLCDMCTADETSLFFSLQPSKTFTFQGDFCRGGVKSKRLVAVLLTCSADGSDELPLLLSGIYKGFKNVKRLPKNMKLIQIL